MNYQQAKTAIDDGKTVVRESWNRLRQVFQFALPERTARNLERQRLEQTEPVPASPPTHRGAVTDEESERFRAASTARTERIEAAVAAFVPPSPSLHVRDCWGVVQPYTPTSADEAATDWVEVAPT